MTSAKHEPVGSVWTVPAKSGERVEVVRPDESVVVVVASSKGALVALDAPGTYVSGDHTVSAK